MRRFNGVRAAALAAAVLAACLTAAPAARAHGRRPPLGIENCTAAACHFDVPPGDYDVTVRLGGAAASASATSISGETRRSLLPETAVAAGRQVTRGFTVNVRTPEGEPTGPDGTPGLDLAIGGPAPALAGIRVTPAALPHARTRLRGGTPITRQIFLVGDSTRLRPAGRPLHRLGPAAPAVRAQGRRRRQLRRLRRKYRDLRAEPATLGFRPAVDPPG